MEGNPLGSLVNHIPNGLVEFKIRHLRNLVECKECKHLAQNEERARQHVSEARHVHSYRHRAYR